MGVLLVGLNQTFCSDLYIGQYFGVKGLVSFFIFLVYESCGKRTLELLIMLFVELFIQSGAYAIFNTFRLYSLLFR